MDLKAVLILLPIFWVFGLEQILSPALIIWATFKLLLGKPKLTVPGIVFPFIIFLIWQIVSQSAIEQGSDRIVFGRNLISYTSAFLILFIIANNARSLKDAHGLIYAMIGLSAVTTVIALLFAIGLLPERFEALLVGNLLPDILQNSRFVQEHIIVRVVGDANATFGSIVYPRVNSLFIFATQASAAYVIFLFWQLYVFQISRGVKRWLITVLFLLSLATFLLTAARIAWGSFLISFTLMKLFRYQKQLRLPIIILPLTLILLGVGFTLIIANDQSPWQLFNAIFVDIRTGSLYDRLSVYEATLRLWAERPITGWGAPKVVSGIDLAPVGTHSQLLGILFRFGLVGFLAYLSIIGLIWAQIILKLRQTTRNGNHQARKLTITVATIFGAINIMHLSYEFYFDFTLVLLCWITIGFIHIPARFIRIHTMDIKRPPTQNDH